MVGVKGRSGGGNRKSVEEHKLDGTYRADRHANIQVPEDKRVEVVPQDHIETENPHIDRVAIFEYFAKTLNEQGMTQEIDSVLLSQLVEAHAMYVTALAFYKTDPEAILGRKLASAVALDAAREVRVLMNEFRLTPSSRTIQISDPDPEKHDPVAAFLSAKVVNPNS